VACRTASTSGSGEVPPVRVEELTIDDGRVGSLVRVEHFRALRSLDVLPRSDDDGSRPPIDLSPLVGLDRLERLALPRHGPLLDPGVLAGLPRLTSVVGDEIRPTAG
jgi:hypothetical protein